MNRVGKLYLFALIFHQMEIYALLSGSQHANVPKHTEQFVACLSWKQKAAQPF